MTAAAATTRSGNTVPWLIIICGCLIAALTFGPRSAMGFFQLPMLAEKGWDRTTFGLAMAIQNLCWGLGQPIFGAIADRFGTWRVLTLGAVLYALGLYLMASADSPGMLHLSGGVLVGLGVAAGSFSIVLAAFARNTNPNNRSMVFGIGTAAGSAGMFIFAPISQGLIDAYGWSDTLVYMSIAMLVIPVLAIPLIGNSSSGKVSQAEIQQTLSQALSEAFGHRSYMLLVSGFFVCGFQVAFITAHFPAYIRDIGIDARYAVIALALIGFFNIIGSLASGIIGQKYSKPRFLAWIYLARSALVAAFLLLPQTPTSVVIFAIIMGLLWLSTVPPTNGLVAIMFGTRHLGMLGGIVFFSHQIGSFLGVWLGGYLYDHFGSYDAVWWLGVALGLFAAAVHWPIKERPVARHPALVPAE
ncbi:putative MFS-type transporter YhjX [Aminobacter sp. MSH1]|uniref:MFS transporter n=1 Tax=Aminobacter sp. MSH1 TaxID=374606 RepID=UPI000D3B32B2|nr:MFS transporter [Aminobacter sp. MSH1]AWC24778.1 putative MFS-type transporter YhjX [Aminobacter sp. MSH1]